MSNLEGQTNYLFGGVKIESAGYKPFWPNLFLMFKFL